MSTFVPLIEWLLLGLLLALAAGSLLNLSHSAHWIVRGWDFPRVQIIALTLLCTAGHLGLRLNWANQAGSLPGVWRDLAVASLAIAIVAWHSYRIIAFTPLAPRQVERTTRRDDAEAIRIVVSNVEMENQQREHWQRVIEQADPDRLIAVEVDEDWMEAIAPLRRQFPYEVAYPQDNWYGMLVLSKLPLSNVQTRFLVQTDIPSVHATVKLRSGRHIRVCGLHPRPPEPWRNNPSRHRDAELVLLAEELEDESLPVIVCGDLNDVAWSSTTRLFLRLSGLLDPRRGRGLYNSFHASHWWLRFPLDHLFHFHGFTLRALQRLPHVGSDHFPILVELQYEPAERSEQPPPEETAADEALAETLIDHEEEEGEKSLDEDQRAPRAGATASPSPSATERFASPPTRWHNLCGPVSLRDRHGSVQMPWLTVVFDPFRDLGGSRRRGTNRPAANAPPRIRSAAVPPRPSSQACPAKASASIIPVAARFRRAEPRKPAESFAPANRGRRTRSLFPFRLEKSMMKPSLAKRTRLLSLGASLLCLFATVGCEVNVEEPGEMPDVDVRGEAGEMPEVDFQGPEVEAEMESSEVQVPDVDVETETQELQVPDIDVSVPGETKNE